jgi:tRNA-uridine 2-sulfurtransferase
MFYTLGQRQGLGIGGVEGADESPWYVVAKDRCAQPPDCRPGDRSPAAAEPEPDHRAAALDPASAGPGEPLLARIRHRQPLQPAIIARSGTDALEVHFESPQRAVTPGQSIVFYRDRECLGGAVIAARETETAAPLPV